MTKEIKIVEQCFEEQRQKTKLRSLEEQTVIGNLLTVLESDIKNQLKALPKSKIIEHVKYLEQRLTNWHIAFNKLIEEEQEEKISDCKHHDASFNTEGLYCYDCKTYL